jgi:transglutaminase-like putative cysteine protease
MQFRIRHVTRFAYDRSAYESHNEVRLAPRPSPGQKTLGFRLDVIPRAAVISYRDAFGNLVHALSVHEPHRELLVVADSLVERLAPRPLGAALHVFSEFLAGDSVRSQEEYDYLHASRYVPFSTALSRFFWLARPSLKEPVAEYVARVMSFVRGQFAYEPGTTDVHSDLDHILAAGGGVCQDFAHLTIGVLRLAGVPATLGRPRALGEQATHAWVEALIPEAGWSGFDPTHGGRTTDHHIRLAVGRDYADVPPLRGVYRSTGQRQTMRVSLDITGADAPGNEPPDTGDAQQ